MAGDARFCVVCGAPLTPTEASRTDLRAPATGDAVGRVVAGRYRLLGKLGEGGMGAVYRAEQISLKRIVALKVLRPELSADAGLVQRFNAEAELAGKLNHPNTVTLYDFGQDSDGALFIAMEYLEGRSLRELLHREGPLPPPRAIAICEQVCSSLGDAHARGIVHRDLKPDNVMLVQVGRRSDVVRVLDFGIAKLRDEQGDITAMPMTRAGDLLGTPQYMAPEQIRGEKVDARTDVYVLGAMLYEMITGRLPFEGPSLMAILSKHLTEVPVPPRQRRPELALPPALEALVMDALQKDPAARPPSMEVVAERLAALGLSAGAPGAPGVPSPSPGGAGARSPSGAGPLHASPPPGVPLLRTPLPGALAAPGARPGAGASPSPAPGGSYSPPPGAPYGAPPGSPAPSAPAPQVPPPGAPAPQVPPPGATPLGAPGAHASSASRGGRGWIAAIAALVVVGGAGAAIFFAVRAGEKDGGDPGGATAAAGPTDPAPSPSPSPSPTGAPPSSPAGGAAVTSDFTLTPERPLYGAAGEAAAAPSAPPPAAPSPRASAPSAPAPAPAAPEPAPAQAAAGGWQGGWYHGTGGAYHIDVPKGFQISPFPGALPMQQFAGDCGGAPCIIRAAAIPTYGEEVTADEISEVLAAIPSGSGVVGKPERIKIAGRRCMGLVSDVPEEGMRAHVAVCPGNPPVMLSVQARPGDFARTAAFRKAFFARRVRF